MNQHLAETLFYNLMEMIVNDPPKYSFVVPEETFKLLCHFGYYPKKVLDWTTPVTFLGYRVFMQTQTNKQQRLDNHRIVYRSLKKGGRSVERSLFS